MEYPKEWQLDVFLSDYPCMKVRPSSNTFLRLVGDFAFTADHPEHGELSDIFRLEISVPRGFPKDLPIVKEIGGKLPNLKHPDREDFHVNPDCSLCLGSPLRLLMKLAETPTLPGFAVCCVVPYLYAISCKLKNGGNLPFGELAHGRDGLLDDYAQIFGLTSRVSIVKVLFLLSLKKRDANKRPCPCGCANRLGRCNMRFKLNRFREIACRAWFNEHAKQLYLSLGEDKVLL